MPRLTKREKAIVSATYPTCGGFATWSEYRKAKKKASGHYWNDKELLTFVAISKSGKRKYFEYCHDPSEKDWCKTPRCSLWYQQSRLEAINWSKN